MERCKFDSTIKIIASSRVISRASALTVSSSASSQAFFLRWPDTIPYRSLIPNESKNLIEAGRPISSTHAAHSAFRIMPICACIEEAAGTAAHFAGRENLTPREVDVSVLSDVLISHGALV